MTEDRVYVRKRVWPLLIVLFAHGMLLLLGGTALGWLGTSKMLDPTSVVNRFHRAATREETARGEVWFFGRVVGLGLDTREDGTPHPFDPWAGCTVRHEIYVSGKNSGWREEGQAWSYSTVIAKPSPEWSSGEDPPPIPLWIVRGGTRYDIAPADVASYLPNTSAPPSSTSRYFKECLRVGMPITVDLVFDSRGKVKWNGDRIGAWMEQPETRRAWLRREAVWASISPIAFAGPLLWLGLMIAFFLRPFSFAERMRSLLVVKTGWTASVVGGFGGLVLGVIAYVALCRYEVVILAYPIWLGSFGMIVDRLFARQRFVAEGLRVLERGESNGVRASSGAVDVPDERDAPAAQEVVMPLTREPSVFAMTELFKVGNKGAVGAKVASFPSRPLLSVTGPAGHFTIDTATMVIASQAALDRREVSAVAALGIDASLLAHPTYWVKESILRAGEIVTAMGHTSDVTDVAAEQADYREPGKSPRFIGKEGRFTLLVANDPELVKAHARRDRKVLGVLVALAFVWICGVPLSIVLLFRA